MPIEHSVYFDGGVQSVSSINTATGGKYSVGIIAAGTTYHFGTACSERMTVINGSLCAKLDSEDNSWVDYPAGKSFVIPANSGFDVKATADTAYHCEYLE